MTCKNCKNAARIAELEAHIETQRVQLDRVLRDRALIIAEREQTFAQMLARAEAAEAERDRLRAEQEQLLADSAIRSEEREKYEKLCGLLSVGKASESEALDAIKALCRDNERLALAVSKARRCLWPVIAG